MNKKYFVLLSCICVCACPLSGCGFFSAMEDLAAEQILMDEGASGEENDHLLPEEEAAETEITAIPEPTEIAEYTYSNYGVTLGQSQESADETYAEDTDMDAGNSWEEEEEEWDTTDEEYIFPNSDTQKLTKADVKNKTSEELRLGRNEIYARHGRFFDDEELQEYFNGKSWYFGCIAPTEFIDSLELNDIERWNAKFIQKFE